MLVPVLVREIAPNGASSRVRFGHLDGARLARQAAAMLVVPVRLRDAATLDDLGLVHAPPPVEVGDIVALEDGSPLRNVSLLITPPGAPCLPGLAPHISDREIDTYLA